MDHVFKTTSRIPVCGSVVPILLGSGTVCPLLESMDSFLTSFLLL